MVFPKEYTYVWWLKTRMWHIYKMFRWCKSCRTTHMQVMEMHLKDWIVQFLCGSCTGGKNVKLYVLPGNLFMVFLVHFFNKDKNEHYNQYVNAKFKPRFQRKEPLGVNSRCHFLKIWKKTSVSSLCMVFYFYVLHVLKCQMRLLVSAAYICLQEEEILLHNFVEQEIWSLSNADWP